jgi:hypothetical protein
MKDGDRRVILGIEGMMFVFAGITAAWCVYDFERTYSPFSLWVAALLSFMMFWPPLRFRLLNGYWRN